mgnify:CR=1 FL=1
MSNGSKHFGGKGSKQRPTDKKNPMAYQDNWEKIFGKGKEDLSRREKVLLDPLEASQRSDEQNKKDK